MCQLVMAPVIHHVDTQLGLSYTFIVLAGSVALAIFFVFIYKKPRRKASKILLEIISKKAIFNEKIESSIKSEDDFSHISEAGSNKSLNVEEPTSHHFLMYTATSAAFSFTVDRATHSCIGKYIYTCDKNGQHY